MKHHLYEINIETEMDVVLAHQKTMRLCKLAGLSALGQTQMGTAVSEIARNSLEHAANGHINFYLIHKDDSGQLLEVIITDTGKGIDSGIFLADNANHFLNKGNGISMSKKLVDHFHIKSSLQGTTVILQKALPGSMKFNDNVVHHWMKELDKIEKETQSPYEELKVKNQQLMTLTQQLEEKNEAIHRHVDEIQGLNTELDKKNQSLVEFAYTLSHDLKNPLFNILALIQLARDVQDKMPILDKIETSAFIIDNIVKGLMQIIDLDQDASASAKTLYFQDIVEKLKMEYKSEIASYQGKLHIDFQVKTISYVEPYLDSIIRNLVSNAIKYHVEERALDLKLATCQQDDYVVLSVHDNGMGMDLIKHQSALFKPFRRFTSQKSGKGIGLHLIKKMVEKNGGKIEVESTPGEGTVFYCFLKSYA